MKILLLTSSNLHQAEIKVEQKECMKIAKGACI